jgi:5,5'-dehydrodivanillate O-demethylase oxygenase subunit
MPRILTAPIKQENWSELVQAAPGTPMGNLLRQFWQPVAVAADIGPGKTLAIRVMNEDLTLYRGHSGQPYVVDQRCAHRLTLLKTGWVEGEEIRCRYHGWKYNGAGQCTEMPAEDASYPAKVRITNYPAQDYAGLIFAYLGDGEPPALPQFAELGRSYGVQWSSSMVWPCNWLQRIENSMDAVHVSFTHQETAFGETLSYTVPALAYEETDWGIRQSAARSKDNVRISDFSFPNCNHIVVPTHLPKAKNTPPQPWTDVFNWFVPIDDEHTAFYTVRSSPISGEVAREFSDWLTQADRYDPADYADELFAGIMPDSHAGNTATALVNAQDYITQVGQGAIVDRSRERLGASDEGIILLRKILRREVAALAAGTAKAWTHKSGFAGLPVPPGVPLAPDAG